MGSVRKSRLSPYKQDRLTEHFVSGLTARTTASLCDVNWKLRMKLCSAEKLKLMKATVVADGKENVAVQCN